MPLPVSMKFANSIAFAPTLAQVVPSQPHDLVFWLHWIVPVLVIILGLLVYGWSDLIRMHWRRVWAMAGVCVIESLRRRVLWVTPLAMIGVAFVSLYQQAPDAEDAIRQTIKFCVFASGLLITIIAVILASTSLPREIENRVIFTIVTKPTTRIEIVLGKVVGFAVVSGLILLIMGTFTYVFLEFRSRPLLADLKVKQAALPPNSPLRPTYEYYIQSGLLGTRSLDWPEEPVQIYARPPQGNEHWMMGGEGQYVLLPFVLSEEDRAKLSAIADSSDKLEMNLHLSFDIEQRAPDQQQLQQADELKLLRRRRSTTPSTTAPAELELIPQVQVRFLDAGYAPLIPMNVSNIGPVVTLRPAEGKSYTGSTPVSTQILERAAKLGQFVVQVSGRTPATDFGVRGKAAWLACTVGEVKYVAGEAVPDLQSVGEQAGDYELIAGDNPVPLQRIGLKPGDVLGFQKDKDGAVFAVVTTGGKPQTFPLDLAHQKEFSWRSELRMEMAESPDRAPGIFGAHPGRNGKRLMAVKRNDAGPVAVFSFHNAEVSPGPDGKVGLQVSAYIERTGEPGTGDEYARATIEVYNRQTHESSGQLPSFETETSRTTPIPVDAKFMKGGDFDVMLRNLSPGQHLGIEGGPNGALAVVENDRSFAINLAKSLFILWLLALLVVIIAVFCSTFVSWPIAIVLTLVILLSHWMVNQLGDALNPGTAGRSTLQVFGVKNPTESFLIANGVDKLSSLLRFVSYFLPDVSKFPVSEDIERGVSIAPVKIGGALEVIFCYGIPMLVFSYVILRRKEVAP